MSDTELLTASVTVPGEGTELEKGVEWHKHPTLLGYSCEIRVSKGEDSGFVACIADLPGVLGQGADVPSAVKDAAEALQAALATYAQEKMPVPWRKAGPKRPDEEAYQVVVDA